MITTATPSNNHSSVWYLETAQKLVFDYRQIAVINKCNSMSTINLNANVCVVAAFSNTG